MKGDDREKLQAALNYLAQSPTGCDLLLEASKHGYKIALDDMEGGYGFADCVSTKLIVLNRAFSPESMALTLAHELAHVRQHEVAGLNSHKGAYRLDEAVRVTFAREADAFAHSVQVALELERTGEGGPYQELFRRGSFVAHVARLFAQEKPEMLDNGGIMAFAFETFYLHDPRRVKYAEGLVKDVAREAQKQEVSTGTAQLALGQAFNSAVLKGLFVFRGLPYLEQHAPEIDLEQAHYSGVPSSIRNAVNILYERIDGLPEQDRRALAATPVYHASAKDMPALIERFQKRFGLKP